MEVKTQVHFYEASLNWETKTASGIATSGTRTPLLFGPPPEFGGTENTWSPEHLLAVSLASCYITTLNSFANLLKVSLASLNVSCKVEFTKKEKGFEATKFILYPSVRFQHDPGQNVIDNLLAKAKKYCFISNSVKGEVVVEPTIINS
jgi:organic hydroperoxide reductase OsmC/OhrA